MNRSINKGLIYAISTLLYATLLVPLVISTDLYFPFVTGKAHLFRLLVEVAFALYLVLILRDRSYLPKRNFLLWSILGFSVILGVATIFAESPMRSFWSNFERMEGYVMILHLFAMFIAASAVMRGRQIWLWLFNTSLVISIIMGIEGFHDMANGIERIAGTLGNSSYLGVYALLHMFIAGFLLAGILRGKRFVEAMWPSILYIVAILFNAAVLYQTGTRGSVVGLAVGVFLISILLAIFEKGLKKKIGLGILIAVVVVVAFFGAFKNQPFIKNHDLLYRFSSLITFDVNAVLQNQGEGRVLLWGVAAKGVQERPILGWGQDNFGYVFAKYYNPEMYSQEQWFDRTHDVFLDWLIAGGVLALLGYLSLFVALLMMLWKEPKGSVSAKEWSYTEKAIFTGMIAAYFVHNLFVFDNLASYIIFFLLLAYVSSRYDSMAAPVENDSRPLVENASTQALIAIVVAALCVGTVYYVVYKPYMAGKDLIYALQPNLVNAATHQPLSNEESAQYRLTEIKKALSYNTFGDTEIRERLTDIAGNAFAALSTPDSPVVPQVLKDYDDLLASEYKKQLAETPTDPRPYILYGNYLQKTGQYELALTYINKAVALSPNKQPFLYQKGTTLIALGKADEGLAVLKQAYDLAPANPEAKVLYAVGLIYSGKYDQAKTFMNGDISLTADSRVLQAYLSMNRFADIVDIIKTKIAADPNNGQLHMSLAGVYLKMHQGQNAIKEIQAAIKIAPQFAALGNFYIKEIQAGRDPSNEPTPTQDQLDAANK